VSVRQGAYALAVASLIVAALLSFGFQETAAALAFAFLVIGTLPLTSRITLRPKRVWRVILFALFSSPVLGVAVPQGAEACATFFFLALIALLISRAIRGIRHG
jgi:hypothetical protein